MQRARRRTNDPIAMRNRVIDAAACAFQTGGYTATSVNDIVRSAGVSGGALHHHFPTKKHIIAAVIAERVGPEVDSTWAQAIAAAPSAIDGTLDIFESVARVLDAQGSVLGCPLGNVALELARADDELRALIAYEYGRWRAAIAQKVADDRQAGRPAPTDGEAFATMIVALFTGAMSIAKVEQAGAALSACAAQLRALAGPRAS